MESEEFTSVERKVENSAASHLPYHVLLKICQYYAHSEGLYATYKCLGNVSKAWRAAATSNKLWSTVNKDFSPKVFHELLSAGLFANTKQLYFPTWIEYITFRQKKFLLEMCPESLQFCSFPTVCIPLEHPMTFPHMQGMEIRNTRELETFPPPHYIYFPDNHQVRFVLPPTDWTKQLSELILRRISGDLTLTVQILGTHFPNLTKFTMDGYMLINEAVLKDRNHHARFPLKSFQLAFPELKEFSLHCLPVRFEDGMPGFTQLKKFSYEPYSGDDSEGFICSVLHKAQNLQTLLLHRCKISSLTLLRLPCNNLQELSFSFCSVVPQEELYNVLCKWKCTLRAITMYSKVYKNEELLRFIKTYGKNSLVHLKIDRIAEENELRKLAKECVKLNYFEILSRRKKIEHWLWRRENMYRA